MSTGKEDKASTQREAWRENRGSWLVFGSWIYLPMKHSCVPPCLQHNCSTSLSRRQYIPFCLYSSEITFCLLHPRVFPKHLKREHAGETRRDDSEHTHFSWACIKLVQRLPPPALALAQVSSGYTPPEQGAAQSVYTLDSPSHTPSGQEQSRAASLPPMWVLQPLCS